MRQLFLFIGIISLSLASCNKQSKLSKTFSCKTATLPKNLEVVNEHQNRFSIELPKSWKTELYNISNQSGIISADTTKIVSNLYKVDFGIINGNIDLSSNLHKQVESIMQDNNLTTVQSEFLPYKGYDSYAHLAHGIQMNMPYYIFQYYIKLDTKKYILIKSEFYGENNVDNRFCESLALINTLKLYENNN
jgi:hypothetical protein